MMLLTCRIRHPLGYYLMIISFDISAKINDATSVHIAIFMPMISGIDVVYTSAKIIKAMHNSAIPIRIIISSISMMSFCLK